MRTVLRGKEHKSTLIENFSQTQGLLLLILRARGTVTLGTWYMTNDSVCGSRIRSLTLSGLLLHTTQVRLTTGRFSWHLPGSHAVGPDTETGKDGKQVSLALWWRCCHGRLFMPSTTKVRGHTEIINQALARNKKRWTCRMFNGKSVMISSPQVCLVAID